MKLNSLLQFQKNFFLRSDSEIIQVQKGQGRSKLEWKYSKLRWRLHEIDVKGELWNQYLCWKAHNQNSKINWREYVLLIAHNFFIQQLTLL